MAEGVKGGPGPAGGPLAIGIAGLGTVGVGVVRLLAEHGDLLAARCGRRIVVAAVSARARGRERGIDLSGVRWHDDARSLAADEGVDAVVELIGGADGIALELCQAAFAHRKPVVSANKALIAHHGTALAAAAEGAGVTLGYEAAVAGGIPVVKALREGLAGNRIERVYGILNGTCNYILTMMREEGRELAEILAEAQALGYAEADPGFDIDGVDTAHKLAILASLAFGTRVDFAGIHVEGIREVGALDIRYAGELGYHIKLLGIASRTAHGIEQRVHPCMVSIDAPIAHVDGVFNAVAVEGDFVGGTMLGGRGAGAGPTASAVVADLVDIARGRTMPVFGIPAATLERTPTAPMGRHVGAYYIRLMVVDRPGVMAGVTAALRDEAVSVEALIQRGRNPDDVVPVVLTTHETREAAMMRALARIAKLDSMRQPPRAIRIEKL